MHARARHLIRYAFARDDDSGHVGATPLRDCRLMFLWLFPARPPMRRARFRDTRPAATDARRKRRRLLYRRHDDMKRHDYSHDAATREAPALITD